MYNLSLYNIKNSSKVQHNGLVFISNNTKVQFAYFEKSKYSAYMKLADKDHSFVWQKWIKSLNDRKEFFDARKKVFLKSLEANYPNLNLKVLGKSSGEYMNANIGTYQLTAVSKVNTLKRKRSNFFTYRKFRFNQLRLFYTTCNQRQFKNLYNKYNYIKKSVLDHFLLTLEGRLEFFLFRTNFFSSKYLIRQYLAHHGVLVNGYKVHSKNYLLKPWDIVSLDKKNYSKVFDSLKSSLELVNLRHKFHVDFNMLKINKFLFKKFSVLNLSPLLSLNFFTNYPRYMEVDYVLLEAMFIRYPSLKELQIPIDSELSPDNRSFYKL